MATASPGRGSGPPRDVRLVLAAQGARAFAYGLGAVLLGRTLAAMHLGAGAGLVLAATVAGTAIAAVLIARYGDRVGRRRCYAGLYLLLAVTGVVFAFASRTWPLVLGGLLGALSTEVVESGPFTSLEQAMLATDLSGRRRVHGFGLYNAVAALAGSLGALCAGLPALARRVTSAAPPDQRWFLVLVPVALIGALLATRLSDRVEAVPAPGPTGRGLAPGLQRSRRAVTRLAGLFAVDSFAGGITVSAFIAYWLTTRFDASATVVGMTFAAMGVLQTASFLAAPRIADRIGLLATMVSTHLVSDVFLVGVGFAPTLPAAIVLLLLRTSLSQMDVPTRQAYVMALVDPGERTAAAAYTGAIRYLTRPFGAAIAGPALQVWAGLPFLVSGVLKAGYDLTLWGWFRHVRLPDADREPVPDLSDAPRAVGEPSRTLDGRT